MDKCKFLDKARLNLCGFYPRPESVPKCLYCNGILGKDDECWVEGAIKAKIREMENMLAKFNGK